MVVAIVGVLTSIAVPNLVSARQSYQLHTAGFTAVNRLGEARMEALKRNRTVTVTLDAAARTMRATILAGGVATTIAGPEYLPAGVVFDLDGAATLDIRFDSLGRPMDPPQSFVLDYPGSGQDRNVSVLSTGRITIQ